MSFGPSAQRNSDAFIPFHASGTFTDIHEPQSDESRRALLGKQTGRAVASISASEIAAIKTVDWKTLPPCPIHRMRLDANGLYDADRSRYLEHDDMQDLINNLCRLEGKTHSNADSRLLGTTMARVFDRGFVVGTTTMWCAAAYFGLYKVPQGMHMAMPQKSILVTRYYKKRKGVSGEALEMLCQRNRTLFNMTNARVLFFGTASFCCTVTAIAAYYVGQWDYEYTETSKLTTSQGQHFEAALKWTYTVYFHHPAYAKLAAQRLSNVGNGGVIRSELATATGRRTGKAASY